MGTFLIICTILGGLAAIFYFWDKIKNIWCKIIKGKKSEENKYDPAKIDKILEIYDSIRKFISEIQTTGSCDINALLKLLRETRHSKVIFKDNSIADYINSLYQKGLDLEYLQKRIDRSKSPQQLDKLYGKQHETFKWFTSQYDITDTIFKRYLND